MRYGLVFKIDVYDFDKGKGEEIVTRPCDFLQVQRWKGAIEDIAEQEVRDTYINYATLGFALKRMGRAKDFGLSDDPITVEEIEKMTERFSVFVSFVGEDELPIQAQTK